ncbi:MAG: acyl-CoA dehydrogenase [Proteobacteria bacterium]|nr:acyl-CoA dehydrogenase [Pseudomonadota bacterium]
MAKKWVSMRNLRFLLNEVFKVTELNQSPYFDRHNATTYKLVLEEAAKLGDKLLHPVFEDMDRKPPELVNGQVKVHPSTKKIIQEFGKNGWISSSFPEDHGGEQLPLTVANACNFIFAAANYSGSVYMGLSAGAVNLIQTFGDETLKKTYADKLIQGLWQGTMALTEPQAGSSLADITTLATPDGKGGYTLQGQKIFISAGDHDAVENVVHLVLAKIEGAPAGVKGISLFVVPKKRIDSAGELISNDVTVTQVFHKMGYRGAPITELSFGEKNDCQAFLVGEPNRGLSYMFQMMNEARLGVGLGATAIASAAYYAALEYTQSRLQGRKLSSKDPLSAQVPLIEHADVKRMLLFQRSVVEGSLSLILQCSFYEDMQHVCPAEDKERYHLLLDLLTPVAKSYPAEMGILSTSMSIQCFGGYGYCEDFPVEQHFRDMRIHTIHEGTTGIQGMDLLGRKLVMNNGKAFFLYLDEVRKTIGEARGNASLEKLAVDLEEALTNLEHVTSHLMVQAKVKGAETMLADAVLYLDMFGIVTMAWQWLAQALVVQAAMSDNLSKADNAFYQGKHYTCRYFFAYELPKIQGLAKRLTDEDPLTLDMPASCFGD